MPRYVWLFTSKIDYSTLTKKMRVMQQLGVPYSEKEINSANLIAKIQAEQISADLISEGIPAKIVDMEVVALISYMQRLGVDYGSLPEEPVELAGPEVVK